MTGLYHRYCNFCFISRKIEGSFMVIHTGRSSRDTLNRYFCSPKCISMFYGGFAHNSQLARRRIEYIENRIKRILPMRTVDI